MTGDQPHTGYFKTRLVKGGPFVPAVVWDNEPGRDEAGDMMGDEGLMMKIDGEFINPQHIGQKFVWMMGNSITKAEYDFMRADSDHAKQYRPDDVKAQPRKAIDLSTQKSIF